MKHTILTIGALALCLSQALAAGGGSAPVKPLSLPATTLRALQGGLSATARQSLGGSITREQQLTMLKTDLRMGARLRNLGGNVTTQPMSSTPWDTGLTLTPLSLLYPSDANYDNFQLALQTRAAWLSPYSPLPAASQTPPLLWLNVAANYDPLCWVEARWPAPGLYLVTFFVKDLWPGSIAKPRVRIDGSMQTPAPNTPTGGDRWTILVDASGPQNQPKEIALYPAESGFGFTACCLSKVVITRLP